MLQPVTFRFVVRNAVGVYQKSILRDATRILNKGFRLALTPEGICDEMTLTARNGPSPSNPLDLGLGLNPLDLVTVQFSTTEMPAESDWLTVYYGEVRQGGNPYDYLGEDMVLRGLSTRLRETPTVEKGYPTMDGGALVRQLVQDTLNSGLLGAVTFPSLTIPPAPEGPADTRVVRYDASAIPDLNFTMTLAATNGQPLGTLLDTIQATALSAGIDCRWGVRADGVLTFLPVLTTEVLWPAQLVEWKPPVSEVVYTAVQWSIMKRQDGTYFKHLSAAPEIAQYGTRAKPEAVGPNLKVWKPLTITPTVTGNVADTPSYSSVQSVISDGNVGTSAILTATAGMKAGDLFFPPPAAKAGIDLLIPAGGADRIVVSAQGMTNRDGAGQFIQTRATLSIIYSDGSDYILTGIEPGGYSAAAFFARDIPRGLPAGATVRVQTDLTGGFINSGGTAPPMQITVSDLQLTLLDTALLDGLAKFHYQIPVSAPGDLYVPGLLPPDQFGGHIRTPRPNAQPDYTALVALWEYTVSGAQGVMTTAKTGQPNTPEREAVIALTRKGDVLATAAALDVA